jgi:hypothetical protein
MIRKSCPLLTFILISTALVSQTPKKSELVPINGKRNHHEVYEIEIDKKRA